MDRAQLSHLAHAHHPIAAPVDAARAAALLARLAIPTGGRVLDLGCGQGEWLLTLLADRADLTGIGVDTSEVALAAAQTATDRRGLTGRVTWEQADAATWTGPGAFDAVLCIGASHALGGLPQTLQAMHRHGRPGGQALLGDGFCEVPPSVATQEALHMTPEDLPDLAGMVEQVTAQGWQPITGHTSSAEEWDDYEWAWTGSLTDWGLQQTQAGENEADAVQALAVAAEHRTAWLRGYRHEMGFVTLLLADAQPATPQTSRSASDRRS